MRASYAPPGLRLSASAVSIAVSFFVHFAHFAVRPQFMRRNRSASRERNPRTTARRGHVAEDMRASCAPPALRLSASAVNRRFFAHLAPFAVNRRYQIR